MPGATDSPSCGTPAPENPAMSKFGDTSQPMSQHIGQSSIIWRHIAESNDNELALLLHPNCWYLAAIATKDVLPPSLHDAADVSMHDATSKPKGGMVGCTCADNTEVTP